MEEEEEEEKDWKRLQCLRNPLNLSIQACEGGLTSILNPVFLIKYFSKVVNEKKET